MVVVEVVASNMVVNLEDKMVDLVVVVELRLEDMEVEQLVKDKEVAVQEMDLLVGLITMVLELVEVLLVEVVTLLQLVELVEQVCLHQ
jgi:hypothetical protein